MKKLRGYIASREWYGQRAPQHIQNIVIREYCRSNNYEYLLSATEYAMENCFLILQELINDLSDADGIIAYSLFQMPIEDSIRRSIFDNFLRRGKEIHFACERLSITNKNQIERVEQIILVQKAIANCPGNQIYHG